MKPSTLGIVIRLQYSAALMLLAEERIINVAYYSH